MSVIAHTRDCQQVIVPIHWSKLCVIYLHEAVYSAFK